MVISGVELAHLSDLREKVRQYITSCHLDDGGYFFAKMPPSSAMDTYYAVLTLDMLGLPIDRPEDTKHFFSNFLKRDSFFSINGLFAAAEVLGILGSDLAAVNKYVPKLDLLRNEMGGFGVIKNLDVEVVSVLETTYRVLIVFNRLGVYSDKNQIARFVMKFKNADGGFGSHDLSTLASTFYATEILKLMDYPVTELAATKKFLRSRDNTGHLNYIEDIYWLCGSLANLDEKTHLDSWIVHFVRGCQRQNGGFSRKDVMGIPTLEDTFYAVSILKILSCP